MANRRYNQGGKTQEPESSMASLNVRSNRQGGSSYEEDDYEQNRLQAK